MKYFSKYNNDPEERKENSTEHGYSKDGLTATSNGNSSNLTSYKSGVVISHWLSTRYTIEFMGIWEKMNNKDFNLTGFSEIRNESGSNGLVLSAKKG